MTREQWLTKAITLLSRQVFKPAGMEVPQNIRVSCGWPSSRALCKARNTGECWDTSASADGSFELFISPIQDDTVQVLKTLTHELIHTVVGTRAKHGPAFKQGMLAVGLGGKPAETEVHKGSALWEKLTAIADSLGPYPHAKLDREAKEKQSTRLLKVECPDCGYVVRVTRKWLDVGLPTCCCGTEMKEAEV